MSEDTASAPAPAAPNRWTAVIRIAVLVFVLLITVLLLVNRDKIQDLEQYGYPGLFLLTLLSSATVLVPVPGVLITSAMGAVFNPFWVAIVSGLGAGLGEISGYLAGFSGRGVMQKVKYHEKLEGWIAKYGEITILVLAFIPNPVFDMAGMTAGVLKMPMWRFLIWCVLGKILKMLVFSYGGATIMRWFS
jgi:uncharacterized membrane protein YdjX (TVP38/TMEM64 family)